MLKIEISDKNASIEASGSLMRITCEISLVIKGIYDTLRPEMRHAFRGLMTEMVTDTASPIWDGKDASAVSGIRTCIEIPKKRGAK